MRLLTVLFLIAVSTVAKKRHFDELRHNERNREEKLYREINEETVNLHVPFGHITIDGIEDPDGMKQPIDVLELNSKYIKGGPKTKEWLDKHNITYLDLRPFKSEIKVDSKDTPVDTVEENEEKPIKVNDSIPFLDLATIQQRNLYNPPNRRLGGVNPIPPPEAERPRYSPYRTVDGPNVDPRSARMPQNYKTKADFFASNSFALKSDTNNDNFSTCDEFGRNAKFHPNHIVNKDWVPFYIWNQEDTALVVAKVHKFTYPTKKLVVKYKEELGAHINASLNWDQPKLLFKQGALEILLIAADRKGLFVAIPYSEIPPSLRTNKNIQIPITSLRLKTVRSYLAMMYCDRKHATIMAVAGNEPKTPEAATSEAATLKMVGLGFPVWRDLEMERREELLKRLTEKRREEEKYINLEDQLLAERSFRHESRRDEYKNFGAY